MIKILSSFGLSIFLIYITAGLYFYNTKLKDTLNFMSTDIANDIATAQYLSAQKKIEMIRKFGFTNTQLSINEAQLKSNSCLFSMERDLIVDGFEVGSIIDCPSFTTLSQFIFGSSWLGLIFIFLFVIFFFGVTIPLFKYKQTIQKFIKNSIKNDKSGNIENKNDPVIKEILNIINSNIQFQIEINNLKLETEAMFLLNKIATQVSHDIRSPLSALNMITSSLDEVSEDKRAIIRSSIQRINDIANDLLKKGKSPQTDVTIESTQQTKADSLLTSAVESILSEKRVQFKNKIKIHISLDSSKAYGIFVAINESEFKRVLSNIINNAVEAIGDKTGVVNLTLEKQNNSAVIKITDNGPGIPEKILEKLGKESVSFGKENSDSGSGLGVLHAKNTIESYGGSFSIQSTQGKGTTITLSLPISTTPDWFLEALDINQDETLIICDDDSSIHSLWKERFSTYPNLKILNFSTLKEIENWLSINENLNSSFKLLIDFEFSNEHGDGLSLISKYNLNEKSILVTSHFEESNIINKCISDDIKQIPKNLAGIVQIKILTESEKIDAVILDDEELQERLWQFAAIQRGKKIVFFNTPDQLFQKLSTINTNTPIYIDSKLADGIKGEDIALHLNKLGYKNLYLTTGYSVEDFKHLTFLKGVIGKTPKFD